MAFAHVNTLCYCPITMVSIRFTSNESLFSVIFTENAAQTNSSLQFICHLKTIYKSNKCLLQRLDTINASLTMIHGNGGSKCGLMMI